MTGSKSRLLADISSLFSSPPHPDIILPEDGPQDFTSIGLHILGPASTPYSQGAWKLTLKLPADYPNSPPKAYFNTKIFHPNVAVLSGEVCVDTLKRDWNSDVDLKHVLLVIRCLLIEPNPESALNEEAGKLLLEDYEDFERMARLMTKIHALKRASFVTGVSSSPNSETTAPADTANTSDQMIYSDAPEEQTTTSASTEDTNVLRPIESSQRSAPAEKAAAKKEKAKRKTGIKRL
ncbi:ubiquitin-conjugating enzyme/RWD-like protein [Dipodascopsis tothii]|uniref:ubiquitin-conjugating enzyme/RWD-like protein n=1 Tax=Dipodascopsis tothii TaxID=44089 RepID=UPI0034CF57B1